MALYALLRDTFLFYSLEFTITVGQKNITGNKYFSECVTVPRFSVG